MPGLPLGQLLVSLIVIGVGLYQLYAAYEAKFLPELQRDRMGEAAVTSTRPEPTRPRGRRGPFGLE